jgi:two-component system chemotaxis response regulator CheB
VTALQWLLSTLPARMDAAIAITIHRSATFVSKLAGVFGAHSRMSVVEPHNGQPFERGVVYLAPQDHHLILRFGALWLDHGPKHHFVRPAVDVMFASGAAAYGPRVIGVLLTGNLSDGVAGLVRIKEAGGLSLVQDPAEAEAPSMPRNAVAYDDVDAVFQLRCAARVLTKLVGGEGIDAAAAVNGARRLPPRAATNGTHEGPETLQWGSNRLLYRKPNGAEQEIGAGIRRRR